MSSDKQYGPGQIPTPGKTAAEQRAEYVAALKSERTSLEARGLKDRVKDVDAELARVEGKPAGRRKPATTEG